MRYNYDLKGSEGGINLRIYILMFSLMITTYLVNFANLLPHYFVFSLIKLPTGQLLLKKYAS